MDQHVDEVVAEIEESLRDIFLRFPCSALEGVRWSILCKAFRERFPEESNALKSVSAVALANAWSEFAVYEDDGNEDDGLFSVRDVASLKQCRNGQLACWRLLLQRLVEIVRSHGSIQNIDALSPNEDSSLLLGIDASLLSSSSKVVGVRLAQLKTLLKQHWDGGFEERVIGFFNETGRYVVIKKMKHLIAELLRWRRSLIKHRREYCDIDAVVETPIILANSQTHNDMILCCSVAEHSAEREAMTPCSMESLGTSCREASLEQAQSEEPIQVASPLGSIASSRDSKSGVSDSQRTLDHAEKMNNRLRIENAELKKKLRFDTDLLNKEIRSLRVENVELKKRLYFSSQYAPHAEQSPMPMNAVWMSPGMMTQVVCGSVQPNGFTSSGQVSPGGSQGSATPSLCYAVQLPQGMVPQSGQPWCTTLIAVPFHADTACGASGGDSTASTTMSPCSARESPFRTSVYSTDSDMTSPDRWSTEPINSSQLQTLSGKGDDRWVCIPSGIVERCTSQIEGCEGFEEDENSSSPGMQRACTSVCDAASVETRTMIPSGIVERCKSNFEGHDGTLEHVDRAVGFAVGDFVMVKPTVQNPKYNWGEVKHGEEGIVQVVDEDGNLHVDFPSQKGWVALPSDMQLCKSF